MLADEEGPVYIHAQKRRGENIWHRGNPAQADAEPNLKDFPDDNQLIDAWNAGFRLAQQVLRDVGIKPETNNPADVNNRWFYEPHCITGVTDAQLNREMHTIDDHVGDGDVREFELAYVQADGNGQDVADFPLSHTEDVGRHLELHDHLSLVVDEVHTDDTVEPHNIKTSSTVNVPGHGPVHKSTLVSALNNSPNGNLSLDRISRVRYGNNQTKTSRNAESPDQIGLFDDVAVYVKDPGQSPEWRIGRILRMRNKERGTVEYHQPISLQDAKKYPKLYLSLVMYMREQEHYIYPKNTPYIDVQLSSVIIPVSMLVSDVNPSVYILSESNKPHLQKFIENLTLRQNRASVSRPVRRQTEGAVAGEGAIIVEIEPTLSASGRQQRKRRQKLYEFS